MGDAVVSALVTEVMGRLTSIATQKFALLWGFKNDILALKEDFINIQAVLHDAEDKHIKEKEVDLWLKTLRSASLMVENVLDDVSMEAMLWRLQKERGINYKVRAFFSSKHNQLMFRVRIAHKVKAIRLKLDAIKSKRVELGLTPCAISQLDVDVASQMPDRETSSHIHDSSTIFGRNAEIEMVIEKICNKDIGKDENDKIRVYGIWGMGGLGKTTLAQLVYNHETVIEYFEITCWIYVSEKFIVKEILQKIIESIDKSECKLTQLDTLQESLQNKLRGTRFLVVLLDDVWIEEDERAKWDELSYALSCGAEESIVVMTTRSNSTSRMMAKVSELQHELGCLSENNSWLLFKKYAFAQGRERDDISCKLEPIGRELAKKCKGLPLAVKTLGSFMWSKRSTSDWEQVKDNNVWESQENKVLPALKLSYDNLAPHLKRCFAYCCLFPKGYNMEKDVVIQLWVSNNFIPPRGDIDLYVLGEEIFNCLVWRSFFIAKVNKFLEDRYLMHDLMHDMAQHVMGDDCLVIDGASTKVKIPNDVLHLSLKKQHFHFPRRSLRKLAGLRSVLMLRRTYTIESHVNQIFNHVYLRVLYLAGIQLRTLPDSICKLKHLKYLNLSRSSIRVLPESIMYLQNLQYLNLSKSSIEFLPDSIIYLQNLQVLLLYNCEKLHNLPEGLRYMINLRKLPWFPISKTSGAKIGELGDLNLLKGKLQISGLENVRGVSEAKSANLKSKANVSVLSLRWSEISERASRLEMFARDEKVLEGLEPNTCLKGLIISNYMGNIISPSWMFKLTNLVEITFYHCKKCEQIPPLGRLPNLRVIGLWDMDSLKCFYVDDNTTNTFLCLQVLSISYCPRLVSLPSNLPKLKVLELKHCMDLVSLPDEIQSFKDLNELDIYNCKHLNERYEKELGIDWPKISHIPNISIDLPRRMQRRK